MTGACPAGLLGATVSLAKIGKDAELKRERGYVDPKTKVFADGREVLGPKDWKKRKEELWARGGGRCEYKFHSGRTVIRCNAEMQIPAHVIPRHPVRDDRISNLKGYCVAHDRLMEKQNWRRIRSDRKEHRGKETD